MAGIGGVIEYEDTDFFSVQSTGVVDPGAAFTPNVFLVFGAVRIGHEAGGFFFEGADEADGEDAFLGVAENGFLDGGEGDVEVDGAEGGIGVKGHGAGFGEEFFAGGIDPVLEGGEGAGFLAALEVADLDNFDFATAFADAFLGLFVGPEIIAVDVAVGEPETTVVGVVAFFAFDEVHGEATGDLEAGGGAQGVEEGLGEGGGDHVIGEMLAVDFDADAVGGLGEFDLGGAGGGESKRGEEELH